VESAGALPGGGCRALIGKVRRPVQPCA
jgi:hypothetical protein